MRDDLEKYLFGFPVIGQIPGQFYSQLFDNLRQNRPVYGTGIKSKYDICQVLPP